MFISTTSFRQIIVFVTGRMPQSRYAGIEFTHRPKIKFFTPLVEPIHVKLGMADGHLGLLGCAKFHLIDAGGRNAAPKISKIFTFLVESPPRGKPLD